MAKTQCKSCGGVFDDVLPDGTRYFHACPPLSFAEFQQAVTDGRYQPPPGIPLQEAYLRRTFERQRKRNENVVRQNGGNGGTVIIAEGRGTRQAPPDTSEPPVVVVPD